MKDRYLIKLFYAVVLRAQGIWAIALRRGKCTRECQAATALWGRDIRDATDYIEIEHVPSQRKGVVQSRGEGFAGVQTNGQSGAESCIQSLVRYLVVCKCISYLL